MSNGSSGADENIKRAAYGALLLLKDNLPENCKLSIQDVDEIVIHALRRHGEHLATHAINQSHLDPFKLLCWLGCAIVERLEMGESFHQHERVIDSLLMTLEQILVLETKFEIRVLPADKELIKRLLMEEIKGNRNHGIGFNGLFIAFHCFRSANEQIKSISTN